MPTLRTRTVRPSSHPLGAGDYETLAAWATGEAADLVALDEIRRAEVYAFADTAGVTIGSGWTTDATRYAHIDVVEGVDSPEWDADRYVLNRGGNQQCITVATAFARIEGIQTFQTGASWQPFVGVEYTGQGTLTLERCILRFVDTAGSMETDAAGVSWSAAASGPVRNMRIRNCILSGWARHLANLWVDASNYGELVLYNVLLDGRAAADRMCFVHGSSTVRIRNVAAFSTSPVQCFDIGVQSGGAGLQASHNTSSDTSVPGTSSQTGVTPSFVDRANFDWHLAGGDTVAQEQGIDLSADGTWPFDFDIAGTTRTDPWDIGPHEVSAGSDEPTPVEGEAYLAATSALSVAGHTQRTATATLLGNTDLRAAPVIARTASATLLARSALHVAATKQTGARAVLTGTAALIVSPRITRTSGALLPAFSSLQADAHIEREAVLPPLVGVSVLSADTHRSVRARAVLAGSSVLRVRVDGALTARAILAAGSGFAVAGAVNRRAGAQTAAVSVLDASALRRIGAGALFAGRGQLSALFHTERRAAVALVGRSVLRASVGAQYPIVPPLGRVLSYPLTDRATSFPAIDSATSTPL